MQRILSIFLGILFALQVSGILDPCPPCLPSSSSHVVLQEGNSPAVDRCCCALCPCSDFFQNFKRPTEGVPKSAVYHSLCTVDKSLCLTSFPSCPGVHPELRYEASSSQPLYLLKQSYLI